MSLIITRRMFLRGLLSVPVVVGLPHLLEPRTLHREPYVRPGQSVGYIGLNLHPSPTFIGGAIVEDIGEWDGEAYPCRLDLGGYGRHRRFATFPDHDLSNFNEDLPPRFWANHTVQQWPNVHAWVRWKRFGESPAVMRAKMAAASSGAPWPYRAAA